MAAIKVFVPPTQICGAGRVGMIDLQVCAGAVTAVGLCTGMAAVRYGFIITL